MTEITQMHIFFNGKKFFFRKDLHLLYWETTNGKRIFMYNHRNKTEKPHEPYNTSEKVTFRFFYVDHIDVSILTVSCESNRLEEIIIG